MMAVCYFMGKSSLVLTTFQLWSMQPLSVFISNSVWRPIGNISINFSGSCNKPLVINLPCLVLLMPPNRLGFVILFLIYFLFLHFKRYSNVIYQSQFHIHGIPSNTGLILLPLKLIGVLPLDSMGMREEPVILAARHWGPDVIPTPQPGCRAASLLAGTIHTCKICACDFDQQNELSELITRLVPVTT